MKPTRARRNKKGPSVALSFTAPASETEAFDAAAKQLGLTRAAFFYRVVAKEVSRLAKRSALKSAA